MSSRNILAFPESVLSAKHFCFGAVSRLFQPQKHFARNFWAIHSRLFAEMKTLSLPRFHRSSCYLRFRLFIKQKCKWKYLRKRHCQTLGRIQCYFAPHTLPAPTRRPLHLSLFCLFIMILQLYLNNIIDFFLPTRSYHFFAASSAFAIYFSPSLSDVARRTFFAFFSRVIAEFFCIRIMDIYIEHKYNTCCCWLSCYLQMKTKE